MSKKASLNSGSLFVHPNQIVKTVQGEEQITPVRQFKVFFPIWNVNVVGQQREGRQYELLEQFIERGIEKGELRSIEELEQFFQLPSEMLRKMIEFLRSVGHLEKPGADGRLHLTQLGRESLGGQRFLRQLETHRTLHFEAFGSRPLLRDHYDLPFQDQAQASRIKDRSISWLHAEESYDFYKKLKEMKDDPDRAQKYNLPDEIVLTDEINKVTKVFAPLCIIEARKYRRESIAEDSMAMGEAAREKGEFETHFLVMSRIAGWRDRFFEEVVNSEPTIAYLLQEKARHPWEQTEIVLEEWVEKQLAGRGTVEQVESGVWRVVLEEEVLKAKNIPGRVRLGTLGEFILEKGFFFQIWCDDVGIRHEASLEQTLAYLERLVRIQKRVSQQHLQDFLARTGGTLQVEAGSWEEFEEYVDRHGKVDLLDEIV